MIIASADTGAALLDGYYRPIKLITTVAVVMRPPYLSPLRYEFKYTGVNPKGNEALIEELKLLDVLLSKVKFRVDVIHLDMTLGSIDVSELRLKDIDELDISRRAKEALRVLLPVIRPYLSRLKEDFEVPILAIGKESIPVRMAELIAAAQSALYGMRRALRLSSRILVGLPYSVSVQVKERSIETYSLLPAERGLRFETKIEPPDILTKISLNEYPNPIARGFRVLEIRPKRS
ncbi:MAG: DUF4152 family protein [Thermoprotei archaeon]|nr:DUF4152 family protein [Thermoprotei archaeon]